MQTRSPNLTSEQIAKWMRQAASRPPWPPVADPGIAGSEKSGHDQPALDFANARLALVRARTKTLVNTIKPFRRLRRNQGAVNEAVIDSLGALLTLSERMAGEIAALTVGMPRRPRPLTERKIHPHSGTTVDPL